MVRTAIQLYTLRDFDVSEPDKIRIASETDVDGVEFEFDNLPAPGAVEALEETGLAVLGVSARLETLQNRTDEVVSVCEELDCERVVLGYLDASHFASERATRETADLLSSLAKRYRERGLEFLYHTHRHEFEGEGESIPFDILLAETDTAVQFELDLGWIGVTGTDPNEVLEAAGDRTVSVHLKDMSYEEERFVNLGEGDLDVEKGARVAMSAGVEWLVYEHENPDDPVESVVTGASKLEKFKEIPV